MADEPISQAPTWLIRHICKPENHRLPKRPDNWYSSRGQSEWQNRFDRPWERSRPAERYLPTHYANQGKTDRVRHLETNDYRLWSEVRDGLSWKNARADLIKARCRWCLCRIQLKDFEAQARKLHKNACALTTSLRLVYEHLLKGGCCVVCDRVTPKQKWGLPICSPKCEEDWVFAETTSMPLQDAIADLRRAGQLQGDFRDASFHDRMFD